ncbi:MAG: creatininase family protein [Candidatus Bathyarchaeota archaeon]|nr:creatininase family protein [Candidatus Bathyarchaeota archaeon]
MSENGKLSKFWLHELTRPAFVDWMENEKHPVAVIGIGSIEQHGPHLPLGMDSLAIQHYIHEVAKRSNSVAVHPCFPGYSPHHMGFPGTITFSSETLMGVLMDTIGSLSKHGMKRFCVMNGHGGNVQIMNLAMRLAKRKYNVMVAAPQGPTDTELAKTVAERQKRHWDVHSGPTETGGALALFPELVELSNLDDWEVTLKMDPKLMEFRDPDRPDYDLVSQVYGACTPPNNIDFTSTGVYGKNDPRDADVEESKKRFEERVSFVTEFIKVWKTIPTPKAFQD